MSTKSKMITLSNIISGGAQAAQLADEIDALILSAGGTVIQAPSDDRVGNRRYRLYRLPSLDRRYNNPICISVCSGNNTTANRLYISGGWDDFDPNTYSSQPLDWDNTVAVASPGYSVPADWPSSGLPSVATFTTTWSGSLNLDFSQIKAWTIDVIVSEYGFFWVAWDGFKSQCGGTFTPMSPQHMSRDLKIRSSLTAAAVPPVGPIGAPVNLLGFGHLRVETDAGYSIVFPTGSTPDADDYSKVVTMFTKGRLEGRRVDELPYPNERLEIRLPVDRVTSPAISSEFFPSIALGYEDPSVSAAGFTFAIGNDAMVLVPPKSIRATTPNINWPLIGARVGGYVTNTSALPFPEIKRIAGFSTSISPFDTIVLTTSLGGWAPGDNFQVLPYVDGSQAGGAYGGVSSFSVWNNTTKSTPNALLVAGAGPARSEHTDVVLNDIYGEQYDHFEIGQTVPVVNNGLVAAITMVPFTNFQVGELVDNSNTGAVGIVRAITSKDVVVDTISGNSIVSYKGKPWNSGDTITGQTSGLICVSGAVEGSFVASLLSNRLGWSTLLRIVDKGRANLAMPNPDMRTRLTLGTSDPGVNPDMKFFLGSVLGIMAKRMYHFQSSNFAFGYDSKVLMTPSVLGTAQASSEVAGTRMDLNERSVEMEYFAGAFVSPQPDRAPNRNTSNFELTNFVIRHTTPPIIQPLGYVPSKMPGEYIGSIPHFRGVTATGVPLTPASFIDEDHVGTSEASSRTWKLSYSELVNSGAAGGAATVNPIRNQFLAIGPGADTGEDMPAAYGTWTTTVALFSPTLAPAAYVKAGSGGSGTTPMGAALFMDSPTRGELRYTGSVTRLFQVNFTGSFLITPPAPGQEGFIELRKNGVSLAPPIGQPAPTVSGGTDFGSFALTTIVSLAQNDILELWVASSIAPKSLDLLGQLAAVAIT